MTASNRLRAQQQASERAMAQRPGLPRAPRISQQLYLAIGLTLAVLGGLTGVTSKFAAETIATAHRVAILVVLIGRDEVLFNEMR